MKFLHEFIAAYTFQQIIDLEEKDEQFLALKRARYAVSSEFGDVYLTRQVFLYLVIQNALVSYQIAGSWPLWWAEFANLVEKDFVLLLEYGAHNQKWRESVLKKSRYNCRLYNMKLSRIEKFIQNWNFFDRDMRFFYDFMGDFHFELLTVMKQPFDAKTVVFAVKMFGYAARIVFGDFVAFPSTIPIPLDSRLIQIYQFLEQNKATKKEIIAYFQAFSEKFAVPPLHLDSLLWLEYRKIYFSALKFDKKNNSDTMMMQTKTKNQKNKN